MPGNVFFVGKPVFNFLVQPFFTFWFPRLEAIFPRSFYCPKKEQGRQISPTFSQKYKYSARAWTAKNNQQRAGKNHHPRQTGSVLPAHQVR